MTADIEAMLAKRGDGEKPQAPLTADPTVVVDEFILGESEGEVKEPERKRPPKIWPFTIEHTLPDGRKVKGQFKNKILSTTDNIRVGVLRSKITDHTPWESLDPLTKQISEAISHCTVSLIERPAWAKNLASIEDPTLVLKIYQEVDGHEAWFRGHGPDLKAGSAE